MRTLNGKLLASGDLTEVLHGNEVVSHLVFRFKDGSLDDDRTVFSQRGVFRLISDHHIQKGPSFPHPTNILIKAATGQITVRYRDKDREKVETDHLDLPPDVANGILLNLLKNISSNTKETKVSYVGGAPKPRLVHLSITPNGEETFSVAGTRHKATLFVVKVEIGGIAGMIATLIGKQPAETKVWVVGEGAPAFVRADEALYVGGPIWSIEITGPSGVKPRVPALKQKLWPSCGACEGFPGESWQNAHAARAGTMRSSDSRPEWRFTFSSRYSPYCCCC